MIGTTHVGLDKDSMPQVPVRIVSGTSTSYGGQAAAPVVATAGSGLQFATRTLMALFVFPVPNGV
jgi:hypothetical protein